MTPANTLSEFRKDLFDRMTPRMQPYGFAPRIRVETFHRKTELGWWVLGLTFVFHKLRTSVTASVGIRVDAVEKFWTAKAGLPPAASKGSATAGVELGRLTDGRYKPWYVTPTDNLDTVADDIVRAFSSFGLPYLERLSNLDNLLEALSGQEIHSMYVAQPDIGCQRAVALALLLGQRQRAVAIATECRGALNRHEPRDAWLFNLAKGEGDPPASA